jgi:hypothetical protein
MDIRETGGEVLKEIRLVKVGVQLRAFIMTVMNIRVLEYYGIS